MSQKCDAYEVLVDEKLLQKDARDLDEAILKYMRFKELLVALLFPGEVPDTISEAQILMKIRDLKEEIIRLVRYLKKGMDP